MKTLGYGLGLDARLGLSLAEIREAGQQAAKMGFESLWTPAIGVPDPFHVCAQWSMAAGLPTGISVVPAFREWRAPALATQAATVALLADGGFTLGIGTGGYGAAFWDALGLPNRPVALMRDLLAVLRRLLRGEQVTHDGISGRLRECQIGQGLPPVPLHIAALGPQMLRLAGEAADGALLNWSTPDQIAWSRQRIAEGAAKTGRVPGDVDVVMYVRVCVDEDVDAARRTVADQLLLYALRRPGVDPSLGYRGHFSRMGFEEALAELELRRDCGAQAAELAAAVPDEVLQAVAYFGDAKDVAAAARRLSKGLDTAVLRVLAARPGLDAVLETMEALHPARLHAA